MPDIAPGPITRFRRLAGWALVGYWATLFLATHTPLPAHLVPSGSDKWFHFIAYTGLAFLLAAWQSTVRRLTWRWYLGLFFVCAVYGVLDELLQIPVNRSPDFHDCLADWSGAAVGFVRAVLLDSIEKAVSDQLKKS